MSKTPASATRLIANTIKSIDCRWLAIWIFIYASFLILDLLAPSSLGANLIKYAGVFLCLAYAYQSSRRDTPLILALLFTFLADTILIWTDQFLAGIFVFCFAQYFHLTRLTKTTPRFLIFYYLIVVSIFLFILLQDIPPLYGIAATYALSLGANLALSVRWYRTDRQNPRALAAMLGFIFFALCDTCVAIQFLSSQETFLPTLLYPISTYLVWLFYYPSQILVSNSSTLTPDKS